MYVQATTIEGTLLFQAKVIIANLPYNFQEGEIVSSRSEATSNRVTKDDE